MELLGNQVDGLIMVVLGMYLIIFERNICIQTSIYAYVEFQTFFWNIILIQKKTLFYTEYIIIDISRDFDILI